MNTANKQIDLNNPLHQVAASEVLFEKFKHVQHQLESINTEDLPVKRVSTSKFEKVNKVLLDQEPENPLGELAGFVRYLLQTKQDNLLATLIETFEKPEYELTAGVVEKFIQSFCYCESDPAVVATLVIRPKGSGYKKITHIKEHESYGMQTYPKYIPLSDFLELLPSEWYEIQASLTKKKYVRIASAFKPLMQLEKRSQEKVVSEQSEGMDLNQKAVQLLLEAQDFETMVIVSYIQVPKQLMKKSVKFAEWIGTKETFVSTSGVMMVLKNHNNFLNMSYLKLAILMAAEQSGVKSNQFALSVSEHQTKSDRYFRVAIRNLEKGILVSGMQWALGANDSQVQINSLVEVADSLGIAKVYLIEGIFDDHYCRVCKDPIFPLPNDVTWVRFHEECGFPLDGTHAHAADGFSEYSE